MTVTPAPRSRHALARKILLRSSLLIVVATLLMTGFSYVSTVAEFRSRMLENLRQIGKVRADYDSVLFEHAQQHTVNLRDEYLKALSRLGERDPQAEFNHWLIRYPDGLIRVRPELDDHRKLPSVYIRPSVVLTPQLRRQVWAAFELMQQWGPALTQRYYSVYIDLPSIGLIMFSPSVNWGALADKTTNNFDYPPVRNSAPDRNPKRDSQWSEVYYDDKARIFMVSAITPVDYQGQWVASVSQDVALDELTARTVNSSLPFSYNLIINEREELLAHPQLMDAITKAGGMLQVAKLQSPLLNDIASNIRQQSLQSSVQESADGQFLLGFAQIRGPGWHFVTVLPQSVVKDAALSNAQGILLIGVVVLLMTLAPLYWLIRRQVGEPLQQLIEATDQIEAGQFDVNININGEGELGELAHRFERMAARISERDQRLQHLAHHDTLTGLPNRLALQKVLANRLADCAQHYQQMAVMFIDLDRFKTINDSLGHSIGDEVLRQVSAKLQACLRDGDFVARLGGDEFIVLQQDARDVRPAVVQTSERLLAALKLPVHVGNNTLHTSPSIGAAVFPDDGQDAETLVRHADMAMYRAKADGRNRLVFYEATFEQSSAIMLEMEGALRAAFSAGEFILYYQPKVQIAGGHLVGFEALVRWDRPGLGMAPPNEFLPLINELGLMGQLNEFVLEQTSKQLAAWCAQGLQALPVSVNLSAEALRAPYLVAHIEDRLQRYQLNPKLLEIEIVEGTLLDEVSLVHHNLRALRSLGIKISIDDFGTGYSALSYLQRFEVDCIKIDRSFVIAMAARDGDSPMIQAITLIGRHLGMSVIAEGVETEIQARQLLALGCEYAQGYHYGRPAPAGVAEGLLVRIS